MTDQFDKLFDKMSELAVQCGKIETRVEFIQAEVINIKEEDVIQNKLLAEHIAGVKTQAARLDNEIAHRSLLLKTHEDHSQARFQQVSDRLDDVSQRLETAEFFPKYMKSTWIILKWLGITATGIVTVAKFLGLW